jgi:hypothetical protein
MLGFQANSNNPSVYASAPSRAPYCFRLKD